MEQTGFFCDCIRFWFQDVAVESLMDAVSAEAKQAYSQYMVRVENLSVRFALWNLL